MALWAAVDGRFTGVWLFEDFVRVVYGAGEPRIAVLGAPGRICGLWTRGSRKRCFAVFRRRIPSESAARPTYPHSPHMRPGGRRMVIRGSPAP